MALPVALFAMISSMSLAGAAVVATIEVQKGGHRDDSAKSAIAAADAGANVARARQNRFGYVLNSTFPCLIKGGSGKLERGQAITAGGVSWCPEVQGKTGDGAYVYQVSPVGTNCGTEYDLCVVSTGTVDNVSRRIEVTFDRSGLSTNTSEVEFQELLGTRRQLEQELIEAEHARDRTRIEQIREELNIVYEDVIRYAGVEGMVGRDAIVLSGNADIRVGLGTNGNLDTTGNATICGDIRVGVGKKWTKSGNAKQCAGYAFKQSNADLPPVSSFMPTTIATNNSNARITTCKNGLPIGCQKDGYTGDWTKKPPFNSSTRQLTLSGNETLTVGGGDYWICGISFSGNSQLIMADGALVRFFFDKPENCGNNGNQLSLSGNNRIAATGYQPSSNKFQMPGFYFLGSTKVASQISLSGNYGTTNEMVVYGPDTYINISGNANFKGILAGKQITMSGNGMVSQDAGFQLPPELNPGLPGVGEEIISGGNDWETETSKEIEERLKEFLEELEELEESEETRTNSAPIKFTPQAYFECTGLAPAGAVPNANC